MHSHERFPKARVFARRLVLASCVTALVIGSSLLVSGCGGTDRTTYEREVAKVGRDVDDAIDKLPDNGGTTITSEQSAGLARDLRRSADELEDLEPPKQVAKAQVRFVRGLRGVADAYERLAADLASARGDEERAERFVEFTTDKDVDKAFDDLAAASELYAAQGYRVYETSDPQQ